jgi:hypothetical protein
MFTGLINFNHMAYPYKRIKTTEKRSIDEHRHLMQVHLGRKLGWDEVIHHKDGNKRNNSLDNLVVMSRSEHGRLHSTGAKPTEETRRHLSRVDRKHYWNKLSPTKVRNIRKLISAKVPYSQIGKKYGIDKKTVYEIKIKRIWAHVLDK